MSLDSDSPKMPFRYQVGGSLPAEHQTYVERQADRELYEHLKRGDYCFIFNSRQMGKSSSRVRSMRKLEADGCACAVIDPQTRGTSLREDQWYAGTIRRLIVDLHLEEVIDFRNWWREQDSLSISPVERFNEFIDTVLLPNTSQPIILFVEEVDNLISLKFDTDGFFFLIQSLFERRAENPDYRRLTFAFLGVATPSDLIRRQGSSAFNVGYAVEMSGFQRVETEPLVAGLLGQVSNPADVMDEVLAWTRGQPFLTQKLLSFLISKPDQEQNASSWVAQVIRERIIDNWETQDIPPHLKTIRDRIVHSDERLQGRLLGVYQQVLGAESNGYEIVADESMEQLQLRLTGLVVKRDGRLQVHNPIYAAIFDARWCQRALAELRPGFYGEALKAWQKSEEEQGSFLLRGQALDRAEDWAKNKRLSEEDEAFLQASRAFEKWERDRALALERQGRKRDRAFVKERQQRETAEQEWKKALRQQKVAKEEAQILAAANKKANQRIKLGFVFFVINLLCTGIAISNAINVERDIEKRLDVVDTRIETSHAHVRHLAGQQLQSLVQALRAGIRWQTFINGGHNHSQNLEQMLEDSKIHIQTTLATVNNIQEQNILKPNQGSILSVNFSRDGQSIVTAGSDGTVKLWNIDGNERATFSGHKARVWSVDVSLDWQTIISGGQDGVVKLWKTDGSKTITFSSHQGKMRSVDVSADGQSIVTGGSDGTVKLWNPDGTERTTLFGHQGRVWSTKFSPDGRTIVSGGEDGVVKLWNANGSERATLSSRDKDNVNSVNFSSDGESIVSAGDDGKVRLWNLDGSERATFSASQGRVWNVNFSPDGQTIVSSGEDGTVKLWNVNGSERANFASNQGIVLSANFSPDGKYIISGGSDGSVKLWNLNSRNQVSVYPNQGSVWSVNFSPDGKTLVSGGEDGVVKLWNADGTKRTAFPAHKGKIRSVNFSPDGRALVSGGEDGVVQLWNTDGSKRTTFSAHQGSVWSVSFSPDGESIVSCGEDGVVKLWNTDGSKRATLPGHQGRVWSAKFSPDGKTIASGGDDGLVKLWNADGTKQATLPSHQSKIRSVNFSPDGQTIVSGGSDGTVKLWNADGSERATLLTNQGWVLSVNFSPDGQSMVSGGEDGTVKLWNTDGRELTTLSANQGRVRSASFSPDGKTIVSGGEEGTIQLLDWDLDLLFKRTCAWVSDYLRSSPDVTDRDRAMCGIPPKSQS